MPVKHTNGCTDLKSPVGNRIVTFIVTEQRPRNTLLAYGGFYFLLLEEVLVQKIHPVAF